MPRVTTRTKSPRATKRPYICTGCRETIEPGQTFYTWQRRYGGPQYRHTTCGYPRPTELSSRKTAVLEEAIQDASFTVTAEVPGDWDGEEALTFDVVADLKTVLEEIASVARDVGSEYESSADNMPESLQYGSQAEAMRDVASRLEDWADDLDSWDPQDEEPDIPERDEDEDIDAYRQRVQAVVETWADDTAQEAQEAVSDMPEYEG